MSSISFVGPIAAFTLATGNGRSSVTVLWVYIALMFLGGLMGFIKAGSKASLIASSIFAGILILFALNIFPFGYNWIVLLFLLIFFGSRWVKSKKMMPNGVMTILTLLTLILEQVF
jgi:uncharacterized membrane protein (UPF0136 family)